MAAPHTLARGDGGGGTDSALGRREAADVDWYGVSAHGVVWPCVLSTTDRRSVEPPCRGGCGLVSRKAGRAEPRGACVRSYALNRGFAPITLRREGATGFDGFGEGTVACPGSQSPGKSTGTIHKPTLNWLWLRKLRLHAPA